MVWNSIVPGTPQVSIPNPNFNKPVIAIGITHTENVTMQWAYKMMGPLLFVGVPWCDKIAKMARGVPQSVARDQIVQLALDDPKITHILWVDTDNCCESPADPNQALEVLYKLNVPIVSGLYRAKQREGFHYAAWVDAKLPDNKVGFTPIQSYTGNFFPVDTIGMGFCLVKREVYEKMPSPWYPWPTVAPSEDFNFCINARKAGYQINLFTDVKLSHIGQLDVKPDGNIKVLEV
jgi:hypothetical protein